MDGHKFYLQGSPEPSNINFQNQRKTKNDVCRRIFSFFIILIVVILGSSLSFWTLRIQDTLNRQFPNVD